MKRNGVGIGRIHQVRARVQLVSGDVAAAVLSYQPELHRMFDESALAWLQDWRRYAATSTPSFFSSLAASLPFSEHAFLINTAL